MSNIISDIVEDIDVKIKPSKTQFYVKWIVRIFISLILLAFVFGQIKMKHLNRLDAIEQSQKEDAKAIAELKKQVNDGFISVNARIDKIYDDGYNEFIEFQKYNNKQLELILDYGVKNKELIKKMLEVNSLEKVKSVENNLRQAKILSSEIGVKKNGQSNVISIDYHEINTVVGINSKDTIFNIIGATREYYEKINADDRYEMIDSRQSAKYSHLYDFTYKNK